MELSNHEIAAEVIRSANREKPADAALREVLKEFRDLAPFDAAEVARLVFLYYRWHGWIRDERGVDARMRVARKMADRFVSNRSAITKEEMRAKAVPSWTAEVLDMPDSWLDSLQAEGQLWLRAKRGQGSKLVQKLGLAHERVLPDAVVYEGEHDLFKTPEFHAGEFEIQDISSQAVSFLCAPKPGETWWDTCAGEGGKLLHLSDLMENKGLIWASDRAEWRLQKLKRRTARAKAFNYRAAQWDGGAKLPTKTKFDGILVDAPCSGMGTWQRNPHARWTTSLQDVQELAVVQKNLLQHVAGSVKPGGKLIYSVCTLSRPETEDVVAAFNASHPEFEPMNLELNTDKTGEKLPPAPTLTLWPETLGGNGMYIAGWRRKK